VAGALCPAVGPTAFGRSAPDDEDPSSQDAEDGLGKQQKHQGSVPNPFDSSLPDEGETTSPGQSFSYFAAAQTKFAASLVSPLPLYFAALG
jgi:hypothetical protein